MRSEQYDYNDFNNDPTTLPDPCYDGPCAATRQEANVLAKGSLAGYLTVGIAWLFGLEALLSDDEN
ncbi:hypothetical protein H3V53_32005 [Paraburkholderia bengalensis]|uniref:Uncharacterized protein n=1 Tax=Paraburkholderia bengalensis TaxID=2747562 RepID=A0ABU8J1F3_9BURK